MAIGPSLRATFATYLPTWLGNVPGLRNLYSTLWSIAWLGDGFRQVAWEGQLAAYPGVGTPTALPYIGASRGLVQGPTEPSADFAARCIHWQAEIANMGNAVGLVTEVQNYLIGQGSLGAGVYPIVSFIDRNGNKTTIDAGQVVTQSAASWNWDEVDGWVDDAGYHSPSTVEGYWSDGWLIIQDPYTHYTGFGDANWLSSWNSGDQTVDSLVPQSIVSQLLAIIDTWKGAHVYVRCIIWVPTGDTLSPNGTWGNWSANSGGTQSATRSTAFAYWQPLDGA